jgi:hypothetical protein
MSGFVSDHGLELRRWAIGSSFHLCGVVSASLVTGFIC